MELLLPPPCVRVMDVKLQLCDVLGIEKEEEDVVEMENRGVEVREMVEKETAFNTRIPCDASMNTLIRESLDVP